MLEKLIDEIGAAKIAEAINESIQTVCNWRRRGVPDGSILKFCLGTNWKVTPHQLRPDLYPHPNDGLPEHLRVKECA